MKRVGAVKWIYSYSKKHIWAVASLAAVSALIALSFIALALLSKEVIDIATQKQAGNILLYCFLFVGVILLQAALNVLNSNIRIRTSAKIEISIKNGIFKAILQKELTELNKYHSGELINRLTSDVEIVVQGIVTLLPQAISMLVKLFAGILVLLTIDAMFTLVLIFIGLAVFIISWFYRKKIKNLHKEVQQTDGKGRSFMQECIENLIVIKSFTSEAPILNRLEELFKNNYKAKLRRNIVNNLANTGVYILFTSSYYFALIYGALKVSTGAITFGALTAFLQVFEQVKAPFRNISGLIPQYFSMVASGERLHEIESIKNEEKKDSEVDFKAIYDKLETLNFENISFSYENEQIFQAATATINKGELTAIIGGSGVGKSTLMKLLLSLLNLDSGDIYLKTSMGNVKIDAGLRKIFAYVPQGNMVLSGSIRENITFFNCEVESIEINNAIEIACVKEFITELPMGLDTLIGERGVGLSEGQVQRIAIARALTSRAPIILLDEATSALDEETESKLLNNLKNLKDRTCIFISHREGTILECDKKILIENLKLVGEKENG